MDALSTYHSMAKELEELENLLVKKNNEATFKFIQGLLGTIYSLLSNS